MLIPSTAQLQETLKRSLVKTISYRIVILAMDFGTIYLITGQVKIATGFMVVSNIYTTLCYFVHERIWEKIGWGKIQKIELHEN
jgi:uncharacterized membrane protein